MIRVILPKHFFSGEDALSDDMIQDICRLSCDDTNFIKSREDRWKNSWQYIKLEYNGHIKYICLSRPDLQARNSFILQNFPTAYQHFLEEENENKSFEYYIRYFDQEHPNYILFSYKLLLTIWIRILNLNRVVPSRLSTISNFWEKFVSLQEMRSYRLKLQENNDWNNSTLFEENEDEIALYWKTYGANWRETWAICLALAKFNLWKPIVVYNVNETDLNHIASVDPANQAIMNSVGAVLSDCTMEIPEHGFTTQEENEQEQRRRKSLRNSAKYHINLLQKFGNKTCYVCWCDIESLIIWSHIHRVTDIENSNLSEDEKKRQIIDWENWLWLCRDHDKMFEDWLIYFEWDEMKINEWITGLSRDFINKITFDIREIYHNSNIDENILENISWSKIFKIKEWDYTDEMHNYLEIHKNRVNSH